MSHRAVVLTTHSMEEAEALCKRIGIMVRAAPSPSLACSHLLAAQVLGQVRALGTKQHLKSKFGSGYELTIKYQHQHQAQVQVPNTASTPEAISHFVTSLFPSTKFISDNGGLMTFSVPSNEMRIGIAFREIETNKVTYGIEDYSIAQSTLEQVFIRTVQAHTPTPKQHSLSASSRQRYEDILGQGEERAGGGHRDELLSEADEVIGVYRDALNSFGCTVKFTKYSSAFCCGFFLLFFILSLALQVSVLIIFAIICLIAFCVCCMLCSCPCCQPPKDDE
jgi:hypothetical protein